MLSFIVFIAFNLVVGSQQSSRFLIGLGDSYSSGGGAQSYPLVAGSLLGWPARNFAVGGSKMKDIPSQLATAGSLLKNATHVVLTTSGNDLGVSQTIQQIVLNNNYTGVETGIWNLQPRLVSTYKIIQNAVPQGTKIFALPYVDFFSVGNKIPNEGKVHEMMQTYSDMIKAAAAEAKIGFIEAVKGAFLGHEMYSADPYSAGLTGPGAAHPNAKGYKKIGEVVANYLKAQ